MFVQGFQEFPFPSIFSKKKVGRFSTVQVHRKDGGIWFESQTFLIFSAAVSNPVHNLCDIITILALDNERFCNVHYRYGTDCHKPSVTDL
jgi:hypothetical protein